VSTAVLLQKQLSTAVDERTFCELSRAEGVPESRRAHLGLVSASGCGSFLEAVPSKTAALNNEPALFIAMLHANVRVATAI